MTEETADHTHDTAPSTPKISFGYAVLVTEEGDVFVERDTSIFSLPVARQATLLEVRRYTSEILMDLQAQSAAEYVTLRLNSQEAQPPSA